MGKHGLRNHAMDGGRAAARGRWGRLAVLTASLALSPALAACSGYSGSGFGDPGTPQQTAAAPPPGPATAAPASASATGAYPSQSIADLFRSDAAPPAQTTNMPHPPSSYTPSGQPYTPPAGQPAYGASAAAPPAASAPPPASAPAANVDPATLSGAYPNQSLSDVFSR